jgi:hypothetical protein
MVEMLTGGTLLVGTTTEQASLTVWCAFILPQAGRDRSGSGSFTAVDELKAPGGRRLFGECYGMSVRADGTGILSHN